MSAREYPKVWRRFERTAEDGRTLRFEIEDVPEALWSTVVEFMLGNYIREDVWWIAAGKCFLEYNIPCSNIFLLMIIVITTISKNISNEQFVSNMNILKNDDFLVYM